MNVLSRLLLTGAFVLVAVYCAGADQQPKKEVFTLYDGFKNDQIALRSHSNGTVRSIR